ncbi:hypothetical protein IMSHALPRED_007867 [Imshaugia aleurites]|uniref:Uncharacterized protein n=1 Tax=Imshaugia aleurites TaxID=172621 RepID=A0A8H3IW47_9LECA|nr:hypothetical protein IMSHALPRED_007867 [Imshaugia aleurites]
MARKSRSRSPPTRNTTLTIRTREPLVQNDIVTPVAGRFISTQADRCPYPDCNEDSPHQHSTTEGSIAPPVDEYRKAGEAIRERWNEEQRRRIAENEAVLRQVADIEPRVGNLSINTQFPRGIILAEYEATRTKVLERQRRGIIENTSPNFPVCPDVIQTADESRRQAEQESNLEWNDFPELDAQYGPPTAGFKSEWDNFPELDTKYGPPTAGIKSEWDDFPELDAQYGPSTVDINSKNLDPTIKSPPRLPTNIPSESRNGRGFAIGLIYEPSSRYRDTDFLNLNPQCTGPCPIQCPHNQGAYLQQGQIPRVWNARWGYSDPPSHIWQAWVRVENGTASSWDQVEVEGFAQSHWWGGP